MVRNKNTSSSISAAQPLTATASITKQGHPHSASVEMGQTLSEMQKSNDNSTTSLCSSPLANSQISPRRRLSSSSPIKAKATKELFGEMNGISKSAVNNFVGKVTLKNFQNNNLTKDSSFASDLLSFKEQSMRNGFHPGGVTVAKWGESGRVSDSKRRDKTERIIDKEPKLEQRSNSIKESDGHISRMQAQTNDYRKMFGRYKSGDEVLARWSDGLYYLGIICDVYDHGLRCEMQFEDESRFWVHFKDLHHINNAAVSDDSDTEGKDAKKESQDVVLKDEEESDVTCVLCRDGVSDPPNEIVLCDKCGQGYHQQCHMPHIDGTVLKDEEMPWQCRNCVFSACVRSGGAIKHDIGEIMMQMKCVLPYDINSLTWNKNHKTNDEEQYCYCGGPGDWYLKMLQCSRCYQWFHEACLQCLESPILYGDRFFLFVCAVCNNGHEFIKRLPMKWVDVVHLVLYNITIAKKVKYYDVDVIIAFFNKHMESLRLGDMAKEVATRSHLRQKANETLQNNKSRFQCGSECKKAKVIWGLRNRSPPLPPSISLPAGIEINEETFSSLDLKHGSASLSDSPTPLKKQGPCQADVTRSPQSRRNAQNVGRSPVKDLVKSGLFNLPSSLSDASRDDLFGSESNMPPPRKRRGRPKKSFEGSLHSGLKRTVSSSSLNSSKSPWSGPPTKKRKRKLSSVSRDSAGSGRASETGSSVSRLWGGGTPSINDAVSSCSSGSTDADSLRDAVARYFGAEGRVRCGERFRVLGKRVTRSAEGVERYEYLIEWEGYTARDLEAMRKV